MQDKFIVYYMTQVTDAFLKGVADKLPFAPLDAVLQNCLRASIDGGYNTFLSNFCGHLLTMVKQLQEVPDEQSGLTFETPVNHLQHQFGFTVPNDLKDNTIELPLKYASTVTSPSS